MTPGPSHCWLSLSSLHMQPSIVLNTALAAEMLGLPISFFRPLPTG